MSRDVTFDEDSFPCKEKPEKSLSDSPDVVVSPVPIVLNPTPINPPDKPDIEQVVFDMHV